MSDHDVAVTMRINTPLDPPEPPAEGVTARTVAESVGPIAAEEALNAIAVALGTAGRAGGSVMSALGELAGNLGWAITVYQAWDAMLSAPSEGRVKGLLDQAFGNVPRGNDYQELRRVQTALAVGAVLSGMSDDEIARLEEQWGGDAFQRGLSIARELQAAHPDDFAEAREIYALVKRNWQDGVAAALEGWYDASRDPVFKQAHARVTSALRSGDPAVHAARRVAQQSKEDGLVDAANGRVDVRRYEADGSYRSGVEHARRTMREEGPGALKHDVQQVELRREQREASRRVPVQG